MSLLGIERDFDLLSILLSDYLDLETVILHSQDLNLQHHHNATEFTEFLTESVHAIQVSRKPNQELKIWKENIIRIILAFERRVGIGSASVIK